MSKSTKTLPEKYRNQLRFTREGGYDLSTGQRRAAAMWDLICHLQRESEGSIPELDAFVQHLSSLESEE